MEKSLHLALKNGQNLDIPRSWGGKGIPKRKRQEQSLERQWVIRAGGGLVCHGKGKTKGGTAGNKVKSFEFKLINLAFNLQATGSQ